MPVMVTPFADRPADDRRCSTGRVNQYAHRPVMSSRPDCLDNRAGTGGWTIASFSKDPKKVELCADLARDIYMGPANALEQQFPTRASLFAQYPVFSTPANARFGQYLKDGQARPGAPVYPAISDQIQIMMGDVLSGTKPVDTAIDSAYQASLDAYKKL